MISFGFAIMRPFFLPWREHLIGRIRDLKRYLLAKLREHIKTAATRGKQGGNKYT